MVINQFRNNYLLYKALLTISSQCLIDQKLSRANSRHTVNSSISGLPFPDLLNLFSSLTAVVVREISFDGIAHSQTSRLCSLADREMYIKVAAFKIIII